ncbi:hypothetical protein O181_093030 [Austropuccinia psidii MF-1]|uniref:Uncharacterized protein n=1 Tax=Austropuccinia psidii MF-1 TaxID=1389203 RepID=A0A9Q3J0X1_9BASI|nr:hypothetical protein [Austropuccinia psidii MF-1]
MLIFSFKFHSNLSILQFLIIVIFKFTSIQSQSQPLPCQRWAHQSTISNSNPSSSTPISNLTLWIQGGQVKTTPDQKSNTWTNALLSLDLSISWNAGSPALSLIQKDNSNPYSPPSVSLGALWSNDQSQSLYLYGGQFSDNPTVLPGPSNVFQFDLKSKSWKSINSTNTSNDQPVQRVSEGASALVPNMGSNQNPLAFYFGGHLDWASVQGWSNSTPRVFLDSIVQLDLGSLIWSNYSSFTTNPNTNLINATPEGAPTIRADGTLTYVPLVGNSAKGVLVSIGGGQNFQSTNQNSNRSIDNSALDVFDLATKTWVKQATQGKIPSPRVNHCAVRGTAKVNGNAIHQIFIYGGQIVNGSSQSTELYVLTIPGFTWTFIGDNLNSQPSARAGHTCDLVGNQMIVIGGYVASDLLCDSQSVYIFDTTTFSWKSTYTPNLPYKTPDALVELVGGSGIGHSTSSAGSALGGDGSNELDQSTRSSEQFHQSNIGAIVGGILGTIVGLILIILAWFIVKRQAKRKALAEIEAAAALEREKATTSNPRTTFLDSEGFGFGSTGSEEMMSNTFCMPPDKRFESYAPASDDPEHDTEGFEPQFSTRLVPRQQLRVMNPENDDQSGSGL